MSGGSDGRGVRRRGRGTDPNARNYTLLDGSAAPSLEDLAIGRGLHGALIEAEAEAARAQADATAEAVGQAQQLRHSHSSAVAASTPPSALPHWLQRALIRRAAVAPALASAAGHLTEKSKAFPAADQQLDQRRLQRLDARDAELARLRGMLAAATTAFKATACATVDVQGALSLAAPVVKTAPQAVALQRERGRGHATPTKAAEIAALDAAPSGAARAPSRARLASAATKQTSLAGPVMLKRALATGGGLAVVGKFDDTDFCSGGPSPRCERRRAASEQEAERRAIRALPQL